MISRIFGTVPKSLTLGRMSKLFCSRLIAIFCEGKLGRLLYSCMFCAWQASITFIMSPSIV